MSNSKNSLNNEVTIFPDTPGHPLRKEIEELRIGILNTNKALTENIKWNAPDYCFKSEDRIAMKIHPQNAVQLIFHCGAKVKEPSKEKAIQHDSALLQWKGNERVATFRTIEEIKNQQAALRKVVSAWIAATSKKLQ